MLCFHSLYCLGFWCVILAIGVLWEPALLHTLFLMKQFADAPERRSTEDTHGSGDDSILYEQRAHDGDYADNQIDNPRTRAPVVFRLDDDGVPHSDDKEGADRNDDSCEV